MSGASQWFFAEFHVDPHNKCLRRGAQIVKLKPRTFDVLHFLVERAGQLVTREELFNALWVKTYVGETTLSNRISELRKALSDTTKPARYIETIHRRGYRFIAPLSTTPPVVQGSRFQVSGLQKREERRGMGTLNVERGTHLVGRDAELAQLHQWLEKAQCGERQIVFVTGEPGIGKTTLIEAFLFGVQEHSEFGVSKGLKEKQKAKVPELRASNSARSSTPSPWIGRGQCVKQYGADEAYLPVFEALGRLCKDEGGERLIAVLRQYAPTWLVQMPGFFSSEDLSLLQPRVIRTTREHMLREIAEAFEVLTQEQMLIFWFDDLHDSDPSTLDLLAYLAQRRESARFLLIGSYRPAEILREEHPLRHIQQELRERRQWRELVLQGLDLVAIESFLKQRFPGATAFSTPELACVMQRRTEGNPLFLVSILEELHAQQLVINHEQQWHLQVTPQELASHVPMTLSSTLEGQMSSLQPEEQEVLQAASVAGEHFTVPIVSAVTGRSILESEDICERLAQQAHFIQRDGVEEWPDTTLATRYRFRHALHQDVAYQRIAPLKRASWHQKIGERREQAFATEIETVAVELAAHFEQSRDYKRAVKYLQQASTQALRHGAYSEAIALATKGLALLPLLPASPYRTQSELTLLLVLGVALSTTRGYAVPEVGQACHRALELCRQADDDLQHFPILSELFGFHLMSAQFRPARELAERLLRLAEQQAEPVLKLAAHLALGFVLWQMGELTTARGHFEQRHILYTPQDHLKFLQFGHDPTVTSLASAAPVLWYLGYPEQARRMGQEALALAEHLAHPHTHAVTLDYVSQVFRERREVSIVQAQMDSHIALCHEHDFREGIARGAIARGWILAHQGQVEEAIRHIGEGIAACEARGTEMDRSYQLAVLAEAYACNGQPDEGLAVLEDALQHVEKTGERYYEAEIYRLQGEFILQSGGQSRKSESRSEKLPYPCKPRPGRCAPILDAAQSQYTRRGSTLGPRRETHRSAPLSSRRTDPSSPSSPGARRAGS
jgi:DNA-binding winged helix-turn-helix (wHTH) protein/predicted ATPase